jgi:serpin B
MTRLLIALAVLAGFAIPAGSASAAELPQAAKPVNEFGADLYRSISRGDENVFYSAYSIHSALGMALAGAKGQTAEQMQTVLHTPSPDAAAAGFQSLADHLKKVRDRNSFELNIANSLWGEQSIKFRDAFTTLLKDRYGSELVTVDFRKAADAARTRINSWVSDQTKGKIPDLIPAGMLNPSTRLVLVNAIYFKAAWQNQFSKGATKDGDFRLASGQTTTARMMNQSVHTRYGEQDDVQILEMPYKGGATSMLLILPRGNEISAAEKFLVPNQLEGLKLQSREVQVTMPSFKMRFKIDLSQQLASMGMPLAFTDQADFSGMTQREPVAISNVVHEAFVAVDEEGTEAAAATAVMMRATAMPMAQERVVFKADHPFVFVIRDNESGAILFAGRLMEPEAK